jgi:predicted PurR-regulated permease PerM
MRNPYSLLLAFLIAVVDVLPFLGTGFILIPWALYNLVVADYRTAVWLVILYLICLLSRQLLQPKIIGDSVGLDPMITLLLIYVGFKLDGLRGILVRNFYKIGLFDNKIKRFQRLFQLLRKAEEELE